jgi:NAD-dependent dihydropyrimidine dehydrogenase PreA subunit
VEKSNGGTAHSTEMSVIADDLPNLNRRVEVTQQEMERGREFDDECWGCPLCGERIPYGAMHEHPFVPFREPYKPPLLSLFRRCESCHKVTLMLRMIYMRRPLGGRPYWKCRPCH